MKLKAINKEQKATSSKFSLNASLQRNGKGVFYCNSHINCHKNYDRTRSRKHETSSMLMIFFDENYSYYFFSFTLFKLKRKKHLLNYSSQIMKKLLLHTFPKIFYPFLRENTKISLLKTKANNINMTAYSKDAHKCYMCTY